MRMCDFVFVLLVYLFGSCNLEILNVVNAPGRIAAILSSAPLQTSTGIPRLPKRRHTEANAIVHRAPDLPIPELRLTSLFRKGGWEVMK